MFLDALLIIVSCVLIVQMGLIDAIEKIIPYRFKILSCPKCLVFWSSLIWHLATGRGVLLSIGTSFVSSYVALWLVLAYDFMAIVYNKTYEKIEQK